MADGKKNMSEFNDEIKKANAALDEQIRLQQEELNSLNSIFDFRQKMNLKAEIYRKEQEKLNNLNNIYLDALKEGNKIHGNTVKAYKDKVKLQKDAVKAAESEAKAQERILRAVKLNDAVLKSSTIAKLGDYLMVSDKPIREVTLQMGLAGERAEVLRDNFNKAATYAAGLGMSLKDLAVIQSVFADETGRAKTLSSQMLIDVSLMAKGTGLGVENASQMAAQFELMGYNVSQTTAYVKDTVEMTRVMGVDTTKVLKNLNKDFKKLQSYTFRGGVKSMAEMAAHAAKFNYDMSSMLDSADKARTLEGAVELASRLQVMGGEFAKTDPFEILFLKRNDPQKYAEKINAMTRGISTFRKTADGTFESYISPMDMDRLDQVSSALGMQKGELVQQARRMGEIQRIRQQMLGSGINGNDLKVIESMAHYDNKKDRFFVEVGGQMKDISSLTKTQINSLKIQKTTLEDNAKQSQTFNEAWQNTMNEFKATLLPVIKGLNVAVNAVRPYIEKLAEIISNLTNSKMFEPMMKIAGMTMAAGFVMKKGIDSAMWLKKVYDVIGGTSSLAKGASTATSAGGSAAGGVGGAVSKGGGFAKGAGVGVAGLGIGAGVGVAAVGISKLADSMSKLDKTQIWALPATVLALSVGMWSLVPAISAAGLAGEFAAPGILAIGGAALGIGAGIGIASAGIGYMASGIGDLVEKAKGSDGALLGIASGIVAINAAMATGGMSMLFGGAVGMAGLVALIGTMSSNSASIAKVGDAFGNIATVMKGSKEDFAQIEKTVNSISNSKMGESGVFSELVSLLKNPLKVEFADKEVGITANISLNMDGKKVFEEIGIVKNCAIQQNEAKQGKRSLK